MKTRTKKEYIEEVAEQIHNWYLEACKQLSPESYNPKAQKSYADLTEEQKEMDRFLANKFIEALSKQEKEIRSEYDKEGCLHRGDGGALQRCLKCGKELSTLN